MGSEKFKCPICGFETTIFPYVEAHLGNHRKDPPFMFTATAEVVERLERIEQRLKAMDPHRVYHGCE